ncbi:uncharacterized protein GGS22DRAFT_200144 [Annulohypoxylon maeteangense]|uniref:uncharacterized protein n=1 Tax=Annulohypoxylon maeteangense TaxID=1927788 RepID=UPI0020085967|nr:uncharacterized protein GGS22DRAFT_200144 [Annulohypoxylon maeteangense]KAI0885075.1 hypothetical protein GGS22DRAFT_200144 [Annulohypoxylon maeteangense]
MDMHMDLKVGLGDEFSFEGHGLSCASSTGSFSSASTSSSMPEPFTPTSGRSTPGLRTISMDHDHVAYPAPGGFELTPPSSAFGGYFPPDAKVDMHRYMNCHSASPSPSRKSSMQTQIMDFDYAPVLPAGFASMQAQDHLEPANHQSLGHYAFTDYVASPQYPVSTPAYHHLGNAACDAPAMWEWSGDSPVSFFGRGNPSASPSPSQPLSTRDRHGLTPPYLSSHSKRRLNVDKVQQKSSALQRAQQHRHGIRIERIAAATFKCNYPNCQRGPFKRQEHLKRHKNIKHAENPVAIITSCPFCDKPFNRKDNYRQHLKLHTLKHRPTRRTDYYPEAQALLDEEINKTKQRSQLKKKSGGFKDED